MSRGYHLVTERLGFSTWRPGDVALAQRLWGDGRVTRLIGAERGFSPEQVAARLAREIETQRRFGVQYWPVFLLADGGFAGCCGLRPRDLSRGVYELGVHLVPEVWRNGYATEAARAAIGFALGSLGAKDLFCGHNPNNQTSKALLQKLGFYYIGDEFYEPTGLMHPSYLYKNPGGAAPE